MLRMIKSHSATVYCSSNSLPARHSTSNIAGFIDQQALACCCHCVCGRLVQRCWHFNLTQSASSAWLCALLHGFWGASWISRCAFSRRSLQWGPVSKNDYTSMIVRVYCSNWAQIKKCCYCGSKFRYSFACAREGTLLVGWRA